MPPRNSVKVYVSGGYYHIYNRGVEKRKIFEDKQDYDVFLSYLKTYLKPKDKDDLQKQLANKNIPWSEKSKIIKLLRLNNFADEIILLCFCLMPNHYHLLIKQKRKDTIDHFMNSLNTRYVMYFNKKYKRVGPLYQGVYKAVLVKTDEQLVHLSAYIHKNPSELTLQGDPLKKLLKQPSSLPDYLGLKKTSWINSKEILTNFSDNNKLLSYKNFVGSYSHPNPILETIKID